MKMNSTQQLISKEDEYLMEIARRRKSEKEPSVCAYFIGEELVFKPHPPTPEAVKKAQFVDKTFVWNPDAGNGSRKRRAAR